MRIKWLGLFIFFISLLPALQLSAQNYVFARLDGSPINTTGWNLQGSAAVGNLTNNNNSEIILCPASTSTSGAVFYNQPINLSICNKWKAEFDFRMFDGSGADGIAFCFLETPPTGFVVGAGMGIPSSANGLKVCFDTYNNCAMPTNSRVPKIQIRWGTGYNECWSQPTLENIGGALSFIRSSNYNRALIEYDNGNIRVSVNGNLLLTGFQTFNFSGYLGFTASTGGSNDNHSIKDVIIYTEMPPSEAGGINGELVTCNGQGVQIGTTSTSGYSYTWIPATGLSNASIADPTILADNNSDTVQFFSYKVQTAFTSNVGCVSTDSIRVTIRPKPKINFSRPGICLNDAIAVFTDSTYTKDPASLPFTYAWYFDDPAASPGNPNSSTLKDPSHVYSAAAVYQVKSKVTSAAGCIDSLTLPFTVNGSIPVANFDISSDRNFCSDEKISLLDRSTVNFGNLTKVDVFWDWINDPTGSNTDLQPSIGKQYTHLYSKFSSPAEKSITVKYDIYSGTSCKNSVIKSFSLVSSPVVSFSPIASLCNNEPPYTILEAAEISGAVGTGTFSGYGVSAAGIFSPFSIGTFPIQYLFVNSTGCKDSATQAITVHLAPEIDAGQDRLVPETKTIQLEATAVNGTDLRFQWQPGIYLNSDTVLKPNCTPLQDIEYLLLVSNAAGCEAADSVFIKVLFKPKVPNAFSPNGDGIYDTWQIQYLSDYPNCKVQVYSRAGQLIFQSTGYGVPWDGNFKGQPLPIGTYYYIIQPGLGSDILRGAITIIR
ncbi:MAG: gliding motility-associated C-terminal domain-containing protein [Bacteroidota bacterium]